MRLLGAEVVGVDSGSRTLKDAINEAMRDWTENVPTTHYVLGSALGPHPYPSMVREFQSVIGREARPQFRRLAGRDPHAVVACVGGGSNAIGLFSAYLSTRARLYGVEAGGRGPGPGITRRASRAGRSASSTGRGRCSFRTRRARSSRRTPFRPGSTIPRSAPSTRSFETSARRLHPRLRRRRSGCLRGSLLDRRHRPGARERSRRCLRPHLAKRMPRKWILVNLSGRGDKDIEREIRRASTPP